MKVRYDKQARQIVVRGMPDGAISAEDFPITRKQALRLIAELSDAVVEQGTYGVENPYAMNVKRAQARVAAKDAAEGKR